MYLNPDQLKSWNSLCSGQALLFAVRDAQVQCQTPPGELLFHLLGFVVGIAKANNLPLKRLLREVKAAYNVDPVELTTGIKVVKNVNEARGQIIDFNKRMK